MAHEQRIEALKAELDRVWAEKRVLEAELRNVRGELIEQGHELNRAISMLHGMAENINKAYGKKSA